MTERLLAALADNGKWLEGFTRLGYESTFREYCDRFTPDYLAAVREAGESGLPALADSLLAVSYTHHRPHETRNDHV